MEETKKIPHVHAELIKAWADGAEIECPIFGTWMGVKNPMWFPHETYRVKPAPIIENEPVVLYRFTLKDERERMNIDISFKMEKGRYEVLFYPE